MKVYLCVYEDFSLYILSLSLEWPIFGSLLAHVFVRGRHELIFYFTFFDDVVVVVCVAAAGRSAIKAPQHPTTLYIACTYIHSVLEVHNSIVVCMWASRARGSVSETICCSHILGSRLIPSAKHVIATTTFRERSSYYASAAQRPK